MAAPTSRSDNVTLRKFAKNRTLYGDRTGGLFIVLCWSNFTFGPWYYRRGFFDGTARHTLALDLGPLNLSYGWIK